MLFSKVMHHCGAGLASQIWCLHGSNQAGIWQQNIPTKNPLSCDNLRILVSGKIQMAWGVMEWSTASCETQMCEICSAPIFSLHSELEHLPLLIRRTWLQPLQPSAGWNVGRSELNTIFSFFLYLLRNYRVGIGGDGEVWDSVLWSTGAGFWRREMGMVSQPGPLL